ncbi:MAG: permease [Devosia sp.]|nr:permease [Devosia sp.]
MTEILLLLAGFLGGSINSLAGGGSFIVFPALLFAGVPPVLANASNTYAALPGYIAGVVGYWKSIAPYRSRLPYYTVVPLIGGYFGAELLLRVSNAQFETAVPWLMLFAVLLFAFGSALAKRLGGIGGGRRSLRIVGAGLLALLLFGISVYGGFFNAGLGVLQLAFFAVAGFTDIHAMNGLKLWMSSVVALVATIRFAIEDAIVWYQGSIALVGVVTGAYVAARLARYIPTQLIRALVIVYGLGMTGYFFYSVYFAA